MRVEPFERKPGSWQYDYTDAYGRRRWGTAASAETAKIIQQRRNSEWDLVQAGVLKPEQVAQGRAAALSIIKRIEEYGEHLKAKQVSERHHRETVNALKLAVKWLKARTVEAIAADKVEAIFNRKMEAGMSPRRRNYIIKALKSFLQLMEDRDVILKNPLRKMKAINEDVDQRNVSRPMTHAEFTALTTSLERPAPAEGEELPPETAADRRREERRLFYLFGARAGTRWEETARLRYQDVDAGDWWLELVARNTKSKRCDSLPIPADLVAALQAWMTKHPDAKPEDPLFPSGVPRLKTWKRDLVRAGLIKVQAGAKYAGKAKKGAKAAEGYRDVYAATKELVGYADQNGGKLHRKCLRLTFGTWLYEAGVDIREAQRLMRHQDINLTSKIYTRPRLTHLKAAAEKVAEARAPQPPAELPKDKGRQAG
jgi:site-specific recombinase XerD